MEVRLVIWSVSVLGLTAILIFLDSTMYWRNPLRGFKNSRKAQRLKNNFEGSFYCRKTWEFSCGSFNAGFFIKSRIPLVVKKPFKSMLFWCFFIFFSIFDYLVKNCKFWLNIWRREWDSNPRYLWGYTHFPSVRLNRSATSPFNHYF